MKSQSRDSKSNSGKWVRTVVAAISNGNYKKGLRQFERWAEQEMSGGTPDQPGYEIARGVYVILTTTESCLERDFGVRWQRGKQSRRETEQACGFCLKRREETAHLLAGARAYICDSCIRECSQVVKELKGSRASKKPPPSPRTQSSKSKLRSTSKDFL